MSKLSWADRIEAERIDPGQTHLRWLWGGAQDPFPSSHRHPYMCTKSLCLIGTFPQLAKLQGSLGGFCCFVLLFTYLPTHSTSISFEVARNGGGCYRTDTRKSRHTGYTRYLSYVACHMR